MCFEKGNDLVCVSLPHKEEKKKGKFNWHQFEVGNNLEIGWRWTWLLKK